MMMGVILSAGSLLFINERPFMAAEALETLEFLSYILNRSHRARGSHFAESDFLFAHAPLKLRRASRYRLRVALNYDR